MKPLHTQKLFGGSIFSVERSAFTLQKNKKRLKHYDIVRHSGSSVILPILEKKRIILIRQRRPAVGRAIWELPAGTLSPGETPAHCARREIIEETGYRAGKLTRLTTLYPSPGFCDEIMHVFCATGLLFVGQALEPDEELYTRVFSLKRVLNMIRSGSIRDAKTIAGLYVWKLKFRSI